MLTIVGLGNPGNTYEHTRHNAGREVVLAFAKKERMENWEESKKSSALVVKGNIENKTVRLALPQTFMNKSGKTAVALRLTPKQTFLVHDDSDLPLGRIKLSFGKRSAGHKGVESVKRALKTWDFWRLRIGIQKKKRVPAENLVLMKFSPQEQKELQKVSARAHKAINTFLTESPEKAMSEFNKMP